MTSFSAALINPFRTVSLPVLSRRREPSELTSARRSLTLSRSVGLDIVLRLKASDCCNIRPASLLKNQRFCPSRLGRGLCGPGINQSNSRRRHILVIVEDGRIVLYSVKGCPKADSTGSNMRKKNSKRKEQLRIVG